jgi:hypothetical protein
LSPEPAKVGTIPAHVASALAELNDIERRAGNHIRQDVNYDVPGEIVSKIKSTIRYLNECGYDVRWVVRLNKYEIHRSIAEPKGVRDPH